MSLKVTCSCGKEREWTAKFCPHCTQPTTKDSGWLGDVLGWIVGGFIFLVFINLFFS